MDTGRRDPSLEQAPLSPAPADVTASSWGGFALCGLALLLAVILYAPTLGGGFLADDFLALDRAQTVTFSEHPLAALERGGRFRPLPALLWSLIYRLFGFHAPLYRAVSLLLHLGVVLALFRLARRLTKSPAAAGLAAVAFATHPLHAEAVAWVSANAELLSALFSALALERYLYFREVEDAPKKRGAIFFTCLCAVLAMLGTTSAYVLPLVLLAAEILPGNRRSRRERAAVLGVVLAAPPLLLLGTLLFMGQGPGGGAALSAFPINLGIALLRFLAPAARSNLAQVFNLVLFLLLVINFAAALYFRGKGPQRRGNAWRAMAFGLSFLIVALAPSALAGRLGLYLEFSRTLYLPSLGWALILVGLLAILLDLLSRPTAGESAGDRRSRPPARALAIAAALLVALPLLTAARANLRPWKDAGLASVDLAQTVRRQAANFQPGQSAFVEGVPLAIRGVPFHPNSFTLSIAFSMTRFPELFAARGDGDRFTLPFYAVSAEAYQSKETPPLKKLRDLESDMIAFDYHLKWDSRWATKKVP